MPPSASRKHSKWSRTVLQESDCPYVEAEHEVLGVDHAQAGQIIAQHWKFPRPVQRAVADHHAAHGDGPLTLAGLLHIADVVAHALDVAEEEQELVPQLSPNAWAGLHMSWPEFQVRLPEIERETRAAGALLA